MKNGSDATISAPARSRATLAAAVSRFAAGIQYIQFYAKRPRGDAGSEEGLIQEILDKKK
jgi:hypothetical protein